MKRIDTYLTEKLHLRKDSTLTTKVKAPKTREEYVEFVKEYFREWSEWEHEHNYHTKGTPFNEKNFKKSYDDMISYAKDPYFYPPNIWPIKFMEYMLDKYDCRL